MLPLYDKDLRLVGWMKTGEHLWDADLEWLAYIRDGHAWSELSRKWIGPVGDGICLDRDGLLVAWSPGKIVPDPGSAKHPPHVPGRPRPVRPPRPHGVKRPEKLFTPKQGWSLMTFEQWLAQG